MEPIRLWRWDNRFATPGATTWHDVQHVPTMPEYAALPRADFDALAAEAAHARTLRTERDALVKERDALRGEVATLRGARSPDDVCEMLCEASCVDVTPERCARIWSLLEHPATTMTTLAVIADERGESYAKAAAERDAATARADKAERERDDLRERLFAANDDARGARVTATLGAARLNDAEALLRELLQYRYEFSDYHVARIDALLRGSAS